MVFATIFDPRNSIRTPVHSIRTPALDVQSARESIDVGAVIHGCHRLNSNAGAPHLNAGVGGVKSARGSIGVGAVVKVSTDVTASAF